MEDKILDIDGFFACPNEIAVLEVSMRDRTVTRVPSSKGSLDLAGNASSGSVEEGDETTMSREGKSSSKKSSKGVDAIWKSLGLGKIDLSYAFAGYALDGRPIINYSEFIDLLLNYGFKIQDVLDFIEDFGECAKIDPKAPIVMTTMNVTRIMAEVTPLEPPSGK